MSQTEKSLRELQLEAVISMLNLNSPSSKNDLENVWKVLVFDKFGQEIIAPLLRISDLRDNGITLHMLLNSDRQQIPDVPAIYFIEPTVDNIQRLCDDISKNLYESFHVNFSSVVSRDLLEMLAQATIQSGTYSSISQVYDQYLNFLCLETDMFSLNIDKSYSTLNHPSAMDSDIEKFMKQVVDRLFSVFITSGDIPIIRAPRGNAAENVANALETKLRDHVRNFRGDISLNKNGIPSQRPLILDRNMDLGTMLHHTWSYQCLAHDIFDMKANRITINSTENGKNGRKVYDLDLTDFFWARNASAPFPQMAADVDVELTKYKKEVEEITRSCGVNSLEEIDMSDAAIGAKSLKTAITALPVLTERKRVIDMHMNIASALLKSIKERSLDAFIVLEEAITKQSKASILEIINSKEKGTPEDKLRSFILFYMCLENEPSKADMTDLENALFQAGCDLAPLKYIRMIRSITKMSTISQMQQPSSSNKSSDFLGRFSSRLADNLNYTGLGSAMDTLISGVKNILPTRQNLPILRIVDNLLETGGAFGSLNIGGSISSPDEDFLYLDPKSTHNKKPNKGGSKPVFQHVYVFVVGGGNYVEYQNLQEYTKVQAVGKRITYGATEICNASSFLGQLSELGKATVSGPSDSPVGRPYLKQQDSSSPEKRIPKTEFFNYNPPIYPNIPLIQPFEDTELYFPAGCQSFDMSCAIVSPEFMIAGVQKAGTTSLFYYLRKHPQIVELARTSKAFGGKEIRFFDEFKNYTGDYNQYLLNFPTVKSLLEEEPELGHQRIMVGESTPNYIRFPAAPARISHLFPKMKFIVLLRNPVDRAYSHYQHALRIDGNDKHYTGGRPYVDFIEAEEKILALCSHLRFQWWEFSDCCGRESSKAANAFLLPTKKNQGRLTWMFQSVFRGLYAGQLIHFANHFPSDQFLIIQSEDFYANTEKVMKRVENFLGLVPYDWSVEFKDKKVFNFGQKNAVFESETASNYDKLDPELRKRMEKLFTPYNEELYQLFQNHEFPRWDYPQNNDDA